LKKPGTGIYLVGLCKPNIYVEFKYMTRPHLSWWKHALLSFAQMLRNCREFRRKVCFLRNLCKI